MDGAQVKSVPFLMNGAEVRVSFLNEWCGSQSVLS